MNQEYYKEVFRLFQDAGWAPEWCDVPVPMFTNTVQAGLPTEIGDVLIEDYTMLPKSLVRRGTFINITVIGDSMKDCGIQEDDVLSVQITEGCCGIREGDIVVAEVDGGITVKTFYRDEFGEVWLLPHNENYNPIQITNDMNVRFIGKVQEIRRKAPHTSLPEMQKIMKRAVRREVTPPSEQAVRSALLRISELVKHRRQWYAVYRVLVDKGYLADTDFSSFVELVERTVPEHMKPPTIDQLQRMCVLSFRKCLSLWTPDDAPVKGLRYKEYHAIAMQMMSML
jgi:phage repressor protein C with HTH and peptisase S24 domain